MLILTHITAYKFCPLSNLPVLRDELFSECQQLGLLGTVLLSEEGININLAGDKQAIDIFQDQMTQRVSDLFFKRTTTHIKPYHRLLVKIKPEIITFDHPEIKPDQDTVAYVTPSTLKQWLDEKQEDLIIIDTRNEYEVAHGKFKQAINLHIDQFTDFPEAIKSVKDRYGDKRIVIYCTGGVRCEKAGPLMKNMHYQEVFQLEGGILNYFSKCGSEHYEGNCFVFDDRIVVNPEDSRVC
jgi:UPF0176 protein